MARAMPSSADGTAKPHSNCNHVDSMQTNAQLAKRANSGATLQPDRASHRTAGVLDWGHTVRQPTAATQTVAANPSLKRSFPASLPPPPQYTLVPQPHFVE